MYIKRALEPVLRRVSTQFKVLLLTGPRQVGKTTLLKTLMEESRRYFS
jgi:predicted AAA+ superfamily ATPase